MRMYIYFTSDEVVRIICVSSFAPYSSTTSSVPYSLQGPYQALLTHELDVVGSGPLLGLDVSVEGGEVIGGVLMSLLAEVVVTTGSSQPNHPGVRHVEVGVTFVLVVVWCRVVVVSSRHPNQPGVLQVVVVLDDVLEVVVAVVVVSSRQPLREILVYRVVQNTTLAMEK